MTVLIVDDQLPFRFIARTVLARTDGFEAIGEVDDGAHVVGALDELHPRLILMDVKMPGIDGIEATRLAVTADPEVTVILCSTYPLAELPEHAVDCGAAGYLQKEQLSPDALRELWSRRTEPGMVTL